LEQESCLSLSTFDYLPRSSGGRTVFVFGDFALDQARFELRRSDCPVAVQPKVVRMLLHLVTQRDRVVGNEELFRVVWPGERVGVASITRAVIGVRRALGEAGDSQHSVRTVRGFGYQFVRPLQNTAPALTRVSFASDSWRACSV